ncbi:MAG: hypothetical protein ACYCO9_13300 [Streptosporangiaceae bacterium]
MTLICPEDDQIPANWWERQVPRVSLGLREVAEKLAPQSLSGEPALPPIEREADRASHHQFWASVLRTAAAGWLHGDRAWFEKTESRMRGGDEQQA